MRKGFSSAAHDASARQGVRDVGASDACHAHIAAAFSIKDRLPRDREVLAQPLDDTLRASLSRLTHLVELGGECRARSGSASEGEDVDAPAVELRGDFHAGKEAEASACRGLSSLGDAPVGVVVGEGDDVDSRATRLFDDSRRRLCAIRYRRMGMKIDEAHRSSSHTSSCPARVALGAPP